MASPHPPLYDPPPRPMAWQSPGVVVAIVIAVLLAIGFLFFLVAGLRFGTPGFTALDLAPFCFVLLFVIAASLWGVMRSTRMSRIPPPPPIQGPMVPMGQTGPVALNCPNCGAPPQNVDRFGVATCTYCNTRFLVR